MSTFTLTPFSFLLSDLSQVETGVAEIFGTTFALADTETITIVDNGDNTFFTSGAAFNDVLRDSVDPDPLTVSRIAFLEFTDVDDEENVFRTAVIVPAASAFTFVLAINEDTGTVRGAMPAGTYKGAVIEDFAETLIYNTAPAPTADSFELAGRQSALTGLSLFADNGAGADADPDGDAFSIVSVNGVALPGGGAVTLASGAAVTVGADGAFTYTRGGAAGVVDSFVYGVQDVFGASGSAAVTVTVGIKLGDASGDVVSTTLDAAAAGPAIALGAGDAISFEGARFGRSAVEVTPGAGGATLTIDGRAVALEGDFTGGDFIVSTGSGATLVEFVGFAPDLADEVAVATADINGVASFDYLTGDGAKSYSAVFQQSVANFANAVGSYVISPDGAISDVKLLFANAKTAANGDVANIGGVADGHVLGFFLIQNGANQIAGLSTSDTFQFTDGAANANVLTSDRADVTLVRNGSAVDVTVLHSIDQLNFDGASQVLSGAVNDGSGRLFVGFEDLTLFQSFDAGDFAYDKSDFDFNDVTMFVQASELAAPFVV